MSESTAKNYHKNGEELVIGGVINIVGEGQIQKEGQPIDIGDGAEVSWDDVQNKPTSFPPSSHNHPISQVNGLQDALDSKIESVAWGDVTGKPSEFPPSAHTHTIADIESLQSMLNDIESRLAALESSGE